MNTNFLPLNYCVYCGKHAAPNIYVCAACRMAGRDVPEYFNSDETYHCTFCGKILNFIGDSTLSRQFYENMRCYPCTAISQLSDPDRGRGYNERALPYMNAALQQTHLPVHIYQAYVRQRGAILDGKMAIALQEAS